MLVGIGENQITTNILTTLKFFLQSPIPEAFRHREYFEEANMKIHAIGLSPIVDPQYLFDIDDPKLSLEHTT
jgi:hypothetical protein